MVVLCFFGLETLSQLFWVLPLRKTCRLGTFVYRMCKEIGSLGNGGSFPDEVVFVVIVCFPDKRSYYIQLFILG